MRRRHDDQLCLRGSSLPRRLQGGRSLPKRLPTPQTTAFASVRLVHEETRYPPVRQLGGLPAVRAQMLDSRQLRRRTELAPAHALFPFVNQSCVSRAFSDSAFLPRSPLRVACLSVRMELHAPAAPQMPPWRSTSAANSHQVAGDSAITVKPRIAMGCISRDPNEGCD